MIRLRKYFIAGIIVLLPLIVTVYVIRVIFLLVDGLLASYIEAFLGFPLPGLGMLITIAFVVLLGMFAANVLGRKFIAFFDRLITCIPMVKTLYVATKQIVDAFAVQPRDAFRRVGSLLSIRAAVFIPLVLSPVKGWERCRRRPRRMFIAFLFPPLPILPLACSCSSQRMR